MSMPPTWSIAHSQNGQFLAIFDNFPFFSGEPNNDPSPMNFPRARSQTQSLLRFDFGVCANQGCLTARQHQHDKHVDCITHHFRYDCTVSWQPETDLCASV
uniref:Uncharacterized protein n=1 Tax=Eutreptiella gymnastica TaxID=73025 RepID=A0A7S4FLD8_9EUGL